MPADLITDEVVETHARVITNHAQDDLDVSDLGGFDAYTDEGKANALRASRFALAAALPGLLSAQKDAHRLEMSIVAERIAELEAENGRLRQGFAWLADKTIDIEGMSLKEIVGCIAGHPSVRRAHKQPFGQFSTAEAELVTLRERLNARDAVIESFGRSVMRDRIAKRTGCNADLLHDALQNEVRLIRSALDGEKADG